MKSHLYTFKVYLSFFTLCLLAACGGNGGEDTPINEDSSNSSNTDTTSISAQISMTNNKNEEAVNWVDADNDVTISIQVNNATSSDTVLVTTSKGLLSNDTPLLDAEGNANIILSVDETTEIGDGKIDLFVNNVVIQSFNFSVREVDESALGLLTLSLRDIDGNTTQTITAASPGVVTATLNNPEAGQIIEFSTDNGQLTANAALTNEDGQAQIEIHSNGLQGVGTIIAIIRGTDIEHVINFQIESQPTQVVFVSAEPSLIALQGMGGNEQSRISFRVEDFNGNPVPNQTIAFSFDSEANGASLSDTEVATDALGVATTTLSSGNLASQIRIKASIVNTQPEVYAQSTQVAISTGVPDQNSTSLSASIYNIEGFNFDNVISEITMQLNDRFNNPVPDGEVVSFRTEGGDIGSTCTISEGFCTTQLTSGSPRVEAAEAAITSNCLLNTSIDSVLSDAINDNCPGWPNPRPWGGRVTILGFAVGEESFPDLNGSGTFDSEAELNEFLGIDVTTAMPFDLSEAFVDYNEDGIFNPELAATNDEGRQEVPIPFNADGIFNVPDSKFNGKLCVPGDSALLMAACPQTPSEESIHVRDSKTVVFSGSQAFITLASSAVDAGDIVIAENDTVNFNAVISDLNNNVMPAGTTVTISGEGIQITGTNQFIVPSTNLRGGSLINFKVKMLENDEDSASLFIEVATGLGVITSFSYDIDKT